MAAALAAGPTHAAQLDYTVDFGVERNDNINLSPTNPAEDTIYRPGVGFSFVDNSETFRANVGGLVEYRHYADDTFGSGFDGDVSGRLDWLAIPDRLTVTLEDTFAQEAIDSFEADSPDNRQQVNILSLGPTVDFRMGEALAGQVELRYVDSNAEVTDEFNSSRVDLALRTIRKIDETSQLSLNLRGQTVDFDDEVTGRNYNRADLFARYDRHLNRFDLELDVGYSFIRYTDDGDDRSEPLFRADVTWVPNDTHSLSFELSDQFSDVATDAMQELEDGISVPGSILTGDTVINASPFKERRASLGYSYTSARFLASIESDVHELDYVDSDEFDQEGHGVRGTVQWIINTRTSVGAFGGLDNIEYTQLGREDEIRRYGMNVTRSFTPHWSARLEYMRYERDTSLPGEDAGQNSLYFAIRYTR